MPDECRNHVARLEYGYGTDPSAIEHFYYFFISLGATSFTSSEQGGPRVYRSSGKNSIQSKQRGNNFTKRFTLVICQNPFKFKLFNILADLNPRQPGSQTAERVLHLHI